MTHANHHALTFVLAAALALSAGCAQSANLDHAAPGPSGPGAVSLDLEANLFSPGDILDRQAALSLTEEQRRAIVEEVSTTQAELVTVDASMRAERERLAGLLDNARVDEREARDAAAALIEAEGRVKALHLGMLIRIKNRLTPEQQAQLEGRR